MERLGRYELLGELGRGAMGVVYKARDPQIDRLVAIKLLSAPDAPATGRPESSGETAVDALQEWRDRFLREAKAAGRLSHSNVVAIHDVGEDRGQPFLVMELVEGEPLDAVLRRRRILPTEEAVAIGVQVAEALGHAHQHGIVHRDVKPANIMLRPDGVVKVTDFGIARLSGADATQTGRILGSPSYMSPEQVAGLKVDGRSDIFSLGVVLYELLTGEKAFHGETISTITYRIVHEEPTPLRRLNPAFPGRLDACLRRAMAKDPAQRYARAAEMAGDLRSAETATPARVPVGEVTLTLPTPPPPGREQPGASVTAQAPLRPRRLVAPPPPVQHRRSSWPWVVLGGVGGVVVLLIAFPMFRASRMEIPPPPAVIPAPASPTPASPEAPPAKSVETPRQEDAERLAAERKRVEEEKTRLAAEQQRLEAERKRLQEIQASRKSGGTPAPQAPAAPAVQTPAPASPSSASPPAPPASGPARFVGNTVIPTEELLALAGRTLGQKTPQDDIRELVRQVTELYASRGFVLARAVPRPGRSSGGVPEIEVFEGRLGSLKVLDLSVREAQAVQEAFAPVMAKGVFEKSAAEAAVKELSERHDLMVRLSFERGSAPGTVNLMVTRLVSEGAPGKLPGDSQPRPSQQRRRP